LVGNRATGGKKFVKHRGITTGDYHRCRPDRSGTLVNEIRNTILIEVNGY